MSVSRFSPLDNDESMHQTFVDKHDLELDKAFQTEIQKHETKSLIFEDAMDEQDHQKIRKKTQQAL